MHLDDYLAAIVKSTTLDDLHGVLVQGVTDIGATAVSGLSLSAMGARGEEIWSPIFSSFPEIVRRAYWREANIKDPLRHAAISSGGPIQLMHIASQLTWDEPIRRVLDLFNELGFRDAVATPVFGRPGALGYFICAFPESRSDFGQADLRRIQVMFSEYYLHWRSLTLADSVTLSRREHEVLRAIVDNKSSADISVQLGVSEHTVNTYIRRCFEKLSASSRIEAALKYVTLGLALETARLGPED